MQPLKIRDLDDIQPAGDYLLDMDDDRRPVEAGLRVGPESSSTQTKLSEHETN
jgi:hypothetical protein